MIFKRIILSKILSTGMKADFALVLDEGEYKAALYVSGKPVNGPPLPEQLDPPKGDLTHWMGNRPGVGLTQDEAERIILAVERENSVIAHRRNQHF